MLTASPSCLSSSGLWLMAWCSLHAGQLTSLETSSQTFPELCLLGGSKSSQTDKTEVSGVYVGATAQRFTQMGGCDYDSHFAD